MIIPNKRLIVRNKKFHALGVFAAPQVCGGERVKSAWEKAHPNWRNPHVLSESKSWYRNRSWFFPPCVVYHENGKECLKLGGFAAMAAASLTERTSAKQRNTITGKKGWWRKIVGGFSPLFESSLSAIGQRPPQQKTNGMIHHESLASPLWPTEKVTFNPQSSWN